MPTCRSVWSTIAWYLFDYTTPKIVTIRSFKVGLINRLVQLIIIAYIIGFVIVYKKGYQDVDVAKGTVTTKVKGIASSLNRTNLPDHYQKVWDTADYTVPPQESNAFFVMTNAIITPHQQQGKCSEDYHVANCTHDSECVAGEVGLNGNGIKTGICDKNSHTCQITAWCPVEDDVLPEELTKIPLLFQAENFTVLIKNFIEFPKFGRNYKRRNVIDEINNSTYLKKCHYNSDSDPFCPVFQLGYIVQSANIPNFTSIALEGGVISIIIKWDCDLDYRLQYCLPSYEFNRLDNENVKIAKGWNFRFSKEYRDVNGTLTRDLYKAYGILFVFSIQGRAGKFSPIPLFINIGSGLALLGLATIMCDLVLLYVLKKKKYYQSKKYLKLVDEDFHKMTSGEKPFDEQPVSRISESDSVDNDLRQRNNENPPSLEYI